MVSIIVPVYNGAQKLGRCVESILNQTYEELELILVDDGSKDNSLEICRSYEKRDPRVRVYAQENRGVSAARNRGLRAAAGEYIQFVDCDDWIDSTMTERLLSAAEAADGALVLCGCVEISGNSQRLTLPETEKTVLLTELEQETPGIFGDNLLNSPCNKLYCREKIREPFQEGLSMGEDLLFNLAYLQGVKAVAFLREPLYFYEKAETGLSSIARSDTIETAERLYVRCMEAKQEWGMGSRAQQDLGRIFVKFFIHGISGIYRDPQRSSAEKKQILKKWMENPNLRQALGSARMPQKKQQLAQMLMKHRLTGLMHGMMQLNRCRKL